MKGKDGMGRGVDYGGAYPPNSKSAEQNLPGENLPEHHFKKKYFNQVKNYFVSRKEYCNDIAFCV